MAECGEEVCAEGANPCGSKIAESAGDYERILSKGSQGGNRQALKCNFGKPVSVGRQRCFECVQGIVIYIANPLEIHGGGMRRSFTCAFFQGRRPPTELVGYNRFWMQMEAQLVG